MKALSVALYSLFTAAPTGDFYAAVAGQLYPGEAPQGAAAFPYVVYQVVAGSPTMTFSDTQEDVLIQFSIFSQGASKAAALDIYEKLKGWLDGAALAVTGYTHLETRRGLYREIREPANNLWHVPVEYRFLLEKSRT